MLGLVLTDLPEDAPRHGLGSRLPSIREVLVGDLRTPGEWIVANIAGSLHWPTTVQKARYRDLDIYILPPTVEGHYPSLVAKLAPDETAAEARKSISAFLSALCWVNHHAGASIEAWTGGGSPFGMVGRRTTNLTAHPFELDYLPEPTDPKARLALALCREAAALNLATYAVIAYFRVFETHFQGASREIKNWLNANIGSLQDGRAKAVLDRLAATEPDVGNYLYSSCRSAAAHGKIGSQLVVDPDDPEDERRLARELPLIRAMAIKLTEEILGVQTATTVYREHLYELSGFKPLFSLELLEALTSNSEIVGEPMVDLPEVNVGLFGQPAFPMLCGLEPVHLQVLTGGAKVVFRRKDGLLEFHAFLDFANERLGFDVGRDLRVFDDGSALAMEVAANVREFLKHYFLNGRMRIDDAETGVLLSRKEAFIPVNVIVNPEGFDAEVARLLAIAESRRTGSDRIWRGSVDPTNVRYSYAPK